MTEIELEDAIAVRDALRSMCLEARDNLALYIKFYKREVYDTGIMLRLEVEKSSDRIRRAEVVLLGLNQRIATAQQAGVVK